MSKNSKEISKPKKFKFFHASRSQVGEEKLSVSPT
jgi:hypothetical protein